LDSVRRLGGFVLVGNPEATFDEIATGCAVISGVAQFEDFGQTDVENLHDTL
jgi:hypothetical protein